MSWDGRSVHGVTIRLTEERWKHVVERHPEMAALRLEALAALSAPDFIQQGDRGELLAIKFLAKTPLESKYLVVVYREISSHDGFILTCYLTREPSARRITIWTS